jgi:tRNA(Ile2) C34 agmatinyltransferase TiaS
MINVERCPECGEFGKEEHSDGNGWDCIECGSGQRYI